MFIGNFYCPDEVPVDDYRLLFRARAGDLFRLEDLDLLHEGPDDFCGQFRDIRVFPDHADKGIHIQLILLCVIDELMQFLYPAFEGLLLGLIGGGQLDKTVVADLAFHIFLVEALNEAVQLPDALLCLRQFPVRAPQLPVNFRLALLGNEPDKIILMLTGVGSDALQFPEQNLLNLNIVNLVGCTALVLTVLGADENFLLMGSASMTDLI